MKRYFYSLCFVLLFMGLNACKKDSDPAPASPVVGRWILNRGLLSGFVAPNTDYNGNGLDLYNNGLYSPYASQIDIRSDKSFLDNIKVGGGVGDGVGTWDYTNSQLTLTYDDGSAESYTYKQTGALEELTSVNLYDITLPGDSTATNGVSGKFQYVYRK